MNPYPRNLTGVLQADVLPGLARIHRLVHAVTVGDVAANVVLACADVNDVRVGFGNGDVTDRGSTERLSIRHAFPIRTAVWWFPNATVGAAEVEGIWL